MSDGKWPPLPDPNPGSFERLTPEDEGRKAGLRRELQPVESQTDPRVYAFLLRLIDAGHNVYAAQKTDRDNPDNRNFYHIYWHQYVHPFPVQGPPDVWKYAYGKYLDMLTAPQETRR